MNQNGKGDSPRNCFSKAYRNNYDDIFKNMIYLVISKTGEYADSVEHKIAAYTMREDAEKHRDAAQKTAIEAYAVYAARYHSKNPTTVYAAGYAGANYVDNPYDPDCYIDGNIVYRVEELDLLTSFSQKILNSQVI